jgi:Domain of unknown function (DUF4157)
MSAERWFRGERDALERPVDWQELADEYGIPARDAAELYDQAVRQARYHPGQLEAIYRELLADVGPIWRPAPGKVTRSSRLFAGMTGTGGRSADRPPTPGKVSRSSSIGMRGDDGIPAPAVAGIRPPGPGSEIPYRAEMEAAFGRSFGNVVAYTGAEEACDGLEARAYAVGETVVFSSASPDRKTVAHELTHVLQHRAARASSHARTAAVSRPGDATEREADQIAGQVAAGQLVRQPISPTAAAVHRETSDPNQVFEFTVDNEWRDVKLKLLFKGSRKDPGAVSGQANIGDDMRIEHSAGENKASLKRAGGKWTGQLASALLRADVSHDKMHVPGFEQLKIMVNTKLLETKVANLLGKGLDLDLLTIAASVEGEISGFVATHAPELAAKVGDCEVQVSGRAEVALGAEELARFAQMVRSSREMTEATKEIKRTEKRLGRLLEKQEKLNKLSKRRTGGARKRIAGKLEKGREAIAAAQKRIIGSGNAHKRAAMAFKKAASGMKSGFAKLAEKALVKQTSRILVKIAAKLIPGLNVVSFVSDLVEISRAIHDLAMKEGQREGGGHREEGRPTDEGSEAADGGGEDSPDAGPDEADPVAGLREADAGDAGAGDVDASEGDAGGVDASEGDAGGVDGAVAPVELHPGAQAMFEMVEEAGGVSLDEDTRETLNDLVPRDLTAAELEQLRERLAAAPRKPGSDAFATLGAIRDAIKRVREGEPRSRLVIDGEEYRQTPDGEVEPAPDKASAKKREGPSKADGNEKDSKGEDSGGGAGEKQEKSTIDDSQLLRPAPADMREGARWDAEAGKLTLDEKWLERVKRLRPPSSKGGVGRATSFVIASQRDVGVSGQPLIEYTVAITVEIDVKGQRATHTEHYTFFYDPKSGDHSREQAAHDLIAAFHTVLEFGEGGSVAIKGDGLYQRETLEFLVEHAARHEVLDVAVVRVKFTRTPPGFKVRTEDGWLTPSRDTVVAVRIPPPATRSR